MILISFVAVAMAGGYKEKSYEPAPYRSSYVPEKKNYETPSYHAPPKAYHAPAYNVKAYSPPQPSYQMKAKAYHHQPAYVEKGYKAEHSYGVPSYEKRKHHYPVY